MADIEYVDEDRFTFVNANPDKILQTKTMTLWAHCGAGYKKLDLQFPSLKAWLRKLAASGPGLEETYEGVTYRFVNRGFSP